MLRESTGGVPIRIKFQRRSSIAFLQNVRRQDRNAAHSETNSALYKEHKPEHALDFLLPPPLQLRRKAHPARAAAGAGHGDEDALLLLVVEVGAVEHGAGLALKEFVERQVAGDDAVVGGERGVLGRRGGGFS